MSERLNKTSICTVIFVGIVDYAQMPVDGQIALKERFNALINEAVAQVSQNDRIILDTGEGAAIALLGAPEDALTVALTLRDSVLRDREQHPERAISVRIGINLGPVRVVNDLNERLNVVGDGINAAQRIMSFANPDRILVSRSYYDIASRLSLELAGMFRYLGVKTDKFVREHEVYGVMDGGDEADGVSASTETAPAPAVQPAASKSAMWRGYMLPVFAVLVALALAWGYWVSRPAESEMMPETTVRQDDTQRVTAEEGSMQEELPKEARKTRAKRNTATSNETAHGDAPSAAPSSQDADSHASAQAVSAPAEPERNPLCSDAQRMLKQC